MQLQQPIQFQQIQTLTINYMNQNIVYLKVIQNKNKTKKKKVGIRALVTASQFKKMNYLKMLNELIPELETSKSKELKNSKFPKLKYIIKIEDSPTQNMINFKSLMQIPKKEDFSKINKILKNTSPDDITNIQFTSGTTGRPKGASLTHFNILNNGYYIADRLGLNSQDKICLSVPLYHCFGMVIGNLCALNFGATIVINSEGFSAQKTLEAITKYKCTTLYGVPTMFYEYIKEYEAYPHQYNINSLNKGVMAGSLCPQVLMEKLKNQWNIKDLQICYGMTETSPVSFQTSKTDSLEDSCSTVGQILPHLESKLINKKGKIVPRGEIGEIYIRGYSVMQKYWDDIKKTNETIDINSWIKTGDLGKMDERGYMQIVGRSKDIIIRGGENIYPKEIEEYLRKIPKIMDVQIVGIPNKKYGEEIFCLIILNPNVYFDKQEVYEFCNRKIAYFKVPKYVKIVDQFPLTVTGKPQKFIIVNDLIKEMDGNEHNLLKYQIREY
ncbi:hypothetical protein IMG5_195940 [Ichthyophthirius multifiliis]|uniref:Uncharacterized protein n=1 Tax=Ichthyophthirius multifiliis TaxID=5932 RepID=G0R510_ICHMU|nr:hypothetical protein IMG5_195940 [Ichthyophthirius multifiliis]EGR27412.1 hypothetical protein IMG5_195940 [Ichthyophthirius multifiliis]|eukprot:XP_004024322.1 hypothetical protein IMG5_195940 [Ichthyophthirius multifiliis]